MSGLVSELLIGRYTIPEPRDETSLLARYEAGVWEEISTIATDILATHDSHRNDEFNARLLPHCRTLVRATGQRMAYEAALAAGSGVSPEMLRLFEATCVVNDPSWFVQHAGLTRAEMFESHAAAVRGLLPALDGILEETGAEPWATAPILSEKRWQDFVERLPVYENGVSSKTERACSVM